MAREESIFDDLARGLADGSVTRGKAIRLMGGALVGAALASVPGVAWANDRCSQGQTRCGDRCVNLNTNERHCGSCRNRCSSKQTCCGGRCVNLQQNEHHCGSCSNRCEEGQECIDGVCGGEVCQGEFLTPVGGGDPICTCGGSCAQSCDECQSGTICTNGPSECGGPTTLACSTPCSGGVPICNPPCPADQECMEGASGTPPFCQPICNPPCPEGTCFCTQSGDGRGNVCAPFGTSSRLVGSCEECPPADAPDATSCIDLAASPNSVLLACAPPCP
jgi:hypothetical protein